MRQVNLGRGKIALNYAGNPHDLSASGKCLHNSCGHVRKDGVNRLRGPSFFYTHAMDSKNGVEQVSNLHEIKAIQPKLDRTRNETGTPGPHPLRLGE